jgi:hypothetical protein
MTGFDVYKLYLSVKLHFTTDNYNFFQYQGKTNASKVSFDKRKDKYFFDKLANKYNQEALIEYFVSQFATQQDVWVGNIVKGQGEKTYYSWKKKTQSLQQTFTEELDILLSLITEPYSSNFDTLFKCNLDSTHPLILRTYFKKTIGLETLVIINKVLPFISNLDKELSDPIWSTTKNKILRYSPFLHVNTMEYRNIIKNKVIRCQSS